MAYFVNDLQYQRLSDMWVVLKKDLHFSFTLREVLGAHPPYLRPILASTGLTQDQEIFITAPKGFVSDLASIPSVLHRWFKPDGMWAPAAVIHDICYQTVEGIHYEAENTPVDQLNRDTTQLIADRLFLLGMRELGVNVIVRTGMYNAVRAMGSGSYQGEQEDERYGITDTEILDINDNYKLFRDNISFNGSVTGIEEQGCEEHTVHLLQYRNLKRPLLYFVTS